MIIIYNSHNFYKNSIKIHRLVYIFIYIDFLIKYLIFSKIYSTKRLVINKDN